MTTLDQLEEMKRAAYVYKAHLKALDDVRHDLRSGEQFQIYDSELWAECKPALLRVMQRRVDEALAEMEKLGVTP